MKFIKKPFVFAAIFSAMLAVCTLLTILDTFVFAHATEETEDWSSASGQTADGTGATTAAPSGSGNESVFTAEPVVTADSYTDENIAITVTEKVFTDASGAKTTYYLADIRLASADYLKTALAGGKLTVNNTQTVKNQASSLGAIFAVNGDGCGQSREYGYVIRNSVAYRTKAWSTRDKAEDLVIYGDGSFAIIDEKQTTADALKSSGVASGAGILNVFSFGPALVKSGNVSVGVSEEISGSKSMASNPRTAIGIVEPLHYVVVVSDGRTNQSQGLSLYELAGIMKNAGCDIAYNLDGGGSSTMYFNGKVVNYPTTNGKYSERAVSDIVYIGYR